VFEQLVRAHPESSGSWMRYAYALKAVGRFGEAVAAFRTAVAADPSNGGAWWGIADLKLARIFPADIGRMEAAIEQLPAGAARIDLHFALAAAFDQAKEYAAAAGHLRQGNALRLETSPYDSDGFQRQIDAAIQTYTPAFFAKHAEAGEPSSAPIFVLGMPRSGSTLVEQILSSHPRVEGTEELFAVQQIAAELLGPGAGGAVNEIVSSLDGPDFGKLGRRYLELTRSRRKTGRERFTDKNPANWQQIGLIHAMLPSAKFVDIRRNPLDCCFANYSQHFLVGADYSYGLEEVAAQYRDYVRFMRHFDEVLPGRVHRLIYEDLVSDTEAEVRRLLDYLELPFEERCLRFFETDRPVHTPSSEQVRQPINRAGIGKWKNYEPWIGDLREALGELIQGWRE
jgi:tetratricopeptide (TPR) repeat protein